MALCHHLASWETVGWRYTGSEAFEGPVYGQVGSLWRGLKIARLYKRNVSGSVTLLPGRDWTQAGQFQQTSTKWGSIFRETLIHDARMFPQCFPVSDRGCIVSNVSFCIQDGNYVCATRQGILTKIWVCEHKQASTHLMHLSMLSPRVGGARPRGIWHFHGSQSQIPHPQAPTE